MAEAEPLLRVRQLVTRFGTAAEGPAVVDDVSFDVPRGGILGLVGDSGSGKSLTALSILRLLPPGASTTRGRVDFEGRNLLELSEAEMRAVRGRKIAMVFQEPLSALSSVHTVGWQLALALRASGQLGPIRPFQRLARAGRERARELLRRVELPDPEQLLDAHAHQLSAGMRKRVMIALALACRPALLIADEPTTGLDAPVQAQILDLLARLVREEGLSAIFITHDLCVVAEVASEVVVLYAGQVVEAGPARMVLGAPQHPYTELLLESLPAHLGEARPSALGAFAPAAPEATWGCRFSERCPLRRRAPERFPRCRAEAPPLQPSDARHRARCFYPRLTPARAQSGAGAELAGK